MVGSMQSVADEMARSRLRAEAALTPAQRIALAFQLWDDDVELFARAQGLDPERARTLLRKRRQAGRRPSRCAQGVEQQLADLPEDARAAWSRLADS